MNDPESLVGLQVSEELFPLLGVAPRLGRSFTASDYEPSAPPVTILSDRFWRRHFNADPSVSPGVAIINKELAQRCWPGEDPIGKRVSRAPNPKDPQSWLTVVGVVENIRHRSLRSRPEPELYRPYAQDLAFVRRISLVDRTQGDPMAAAAGLRRRIHQVNPDQPVSEVKTMDVWVREAAPSLDSIRSCSRSSPDWRRRFPWLASTRSWPTQLRKGPVSWESAPLSARQAQI